MSKGTVTFFLSPPPLCIRHSACMYLFRITYKKTKQQELNSWMRYSPAHATYCTTAYTLHHKCANLAATSSNSTGTSFRVTFP